MKFAIPLMIFLLLVKVSNAQRGGYLTGDLQLFAQLYDDDPVIGTNTTQYKRELSSARGWLFLNYRSDLINARVRFDGFYNTPLFNPQEAYTAQGLGFYQISKQVGKLHLTGGHFYDQIGSGIIFRAYEERQLGLDYAVQGFRVKYDLGNTARVMAFTGLQKDRLGLQNQPIMGLNLEKDFYVNNDLAMFTGFGVVNRTLDQETMNQVAAEINGYPDIEDRFEPHYNYYAFTVYNNLTYKNIGWYTELAYKTHEAVRNPEGDRLLDEDGFAIYTAVNYSLKGFGLSVQYRKNRFMDMRTSPYVDALEGIINFMPPITKQQSQVLTGRYSPQTLPFGEEGYQLEMVFTPTKGNTVTINMSYVNDGSDPRLFSAPAIAIEGDADTINPTVKLYHEIHADYTRKWNTRFKTMVGLQWLNYNREVYQGKPGAKMVEAIVPYGEVTYKLDRRKSLKFQGQYMRTDEDQGDFVYLLLEYTMAPRFSITLADMVNTQPREDSELKEDDALIHYYTIYGTYTLDQTRFELGYIKQVEGVVCTGGVCRVEPAFSGLRFGVSTNF